MDELPDFLERTFLEKELEQEDELIEETNAEVEKTDTFRDMTSDWKGI